MFLEEESYNKYRSNAKALVSIKYSAVCGEGKVQIITLFSSPNPIYPYSVDTNTSDNIILRRIYFVLNIY